MMRRLRAALVVGIVTIGAAAASGCARVLVYDMTPGSDRIPPITRCSYQQRRT